MPDLIIVLLSIISAFITLGAFVFQLPNRYGRFEFNPYWILFGIISISLIAWLSIAANYDIPAPIARQITLSSVKINGMDIISDGAVIYNLNSRFGMHFPENTKFVVTTYQDSYLGKYGIYWIITSKTTVELENDE